MIFLVLIKQWVHKTRPMDFIVSLSPSSFKTLDLILTILIIKSVKWKKPPFSYDSGYNYNKHFESSQKLQKDGIGI